MSDLLPWFRSGASMNGTEFDFRWVFLTVGLSTLVAAGYTAIAFNWYFQSRMSRSAESRASLARLRWLALLCAVCGVYFLMSDVQWSVWRLYDLVLGLIVIQTWWFVWKTRGMSLVVERLAQVNELEREAGRYRDIAELLPQMVWTAGTDGRIDYMNQRWREYAGLDYTWLDATHPEERREVHAWWGEAITKRTSVSREMRLGGRNGYRTFSVRATPIVRGDRVKWLGACADIEDQRLLAAEKENQAKQKTFLLNALGHDLRAPLNSIVLHAQFLKMMSHDAESNESAEHIIEDAIAAGDLLAKLLDYAKSGAQDRNYLTPVSLSGLLRQIERRFSVIASEKKLYLKVEASQDITITTDRLKLERVLGNLIDNAIKFTSEGGITLELAGDEEMVAVRVKDTGPGVPEQHTQHLFDEFYQVNNHERDRRKGFGMGLAICKSLAQQIGGDVHLASTGPGGSCFEVVLTSADHAGRRRQECAQGTVADPKEEELRVA